MTHFFLLWLYARNQHYETKMQTRGRISLIVYCVTWQLPCNYFYWHQDWWIFVPYTYFSFSLPPYRSLDLKDYESWTKGSEVKTQFTYRIQQYCRKESSLAVTHQRVLLDAVLAEVPLNLFDPYSSYLSGVWEHGDCQTCTAKGIFLHPRISTTQISTNLSGSFRLIWGNKCWCLR